MFSMLNLPGYCDGTNIYNVQGGVSLNECKKYCLEREDCSFASYSSSDELYSPDGTHCMLYADCASLSDFQKDLWMSHQKTDFDYHIDMMASNGYCSGSPFKDVKNKGTNFADCRQYCYDDPNCAYMSYSSQDRSYSADGTHCMLYAEGSCPTQSDFGAEKWVTGIKRSGKPLFPQTGIDKPSCCYSPTDGDPHTETAYIKQTSPVSVLFDAGPDVQCEKPSRQLSVADGLRPSMALV